MLPAARCRARPPRRARRCRAPNLSACTTARSASSPPRCLPGSRGSSRCATWCRLTAGGDGVEQDGAQALGGAVDRGGQACRTGADDEQVAQPCRASAARCETQGPGQLGVGRVAQDAMSAPDDDRGLVRRDAERAAAAPRRRGRPRGRRDGAAGGCGRELAQPAGVGREAGPDDPEAGPRADSPSAAGR